MCVYTCRRPADHVRVGPLRHEALAFQSCLLTKARQLGLEHGLRQYRRPHRTSSLLRRVLQPSERDSECLCPHHGGQHSAGVLQRSPGRRRNAEQLPEKELSEASREAGAREQLLHVQCYQHCQQRIAPHHAKLSGSDLWR